MFTWRRVVSLLAAVAVAAFFSTARPDLVAQEPGVDGALPVQAPERAQQQFAEALQLVANGKDPSSRLSTALSKLNDLGNERARRGAFGAPAASELPPLVRGAASAGTLKIDDSGDVQVYVETEGDVRPVADALESRGFVVENSNGDVRIVQARVPAAALDDVSSLPGVKFVREPDYAHLNVGSELTEGDAIHLGPELRAAFNADGGGVKVGVISDGVEAIEDAQASGDLPANVNFTTCDVIEAAPAGQPADADDLNAGSEGTAMLEIVHDIAPGADLYFGYFGLGAGGTSLDFIDAVDCLAAVTDVVVDDIGFFNNGLYDGTSAVSTNASTELNRITNRIRGYYNAVGNSARGHYQESFLDSGFTIEGGTTDWSIHEFAATANTTDGGLGYFCSDLPAQGFCADTIVLAPGGFVSVLMQWSDPWGASSTDYDLFLINESPDPDQLLLASATTQDGNDNPVEGFGWQNVTGTDQFIDVVIARFGAEPVRMFDIFVNCSGCYVIGPNNDRHNFNTQSSSVPNNSDAGGGVMSLGAINQADAGNDTIESFSSRGPTNNGAIKPDASAIDGVSITGAGGFPVPFFGSSAAAPHAAAIAALILSCKAPLLHGEPGDQPANDRTTLRNALINSAVDLGTAGNDNTFGRGRLNANAAATAVGCSTDGDSDGTLNLTDNCPTTPNASQVNSDGDPFETSGSADDVTRPNSDVHGDACDADDDNDGRSDTQEITTVCFGVNATSSVLLDSDDDRVADRAECIMTTDGSNPASKPPLYSFELDPDRDGLLAAHEVLIGTNPNDVDSDDDGIHDGLEFKGYNTDPLGFDADGDGCTDAKEIASVNTDVHVNSGDLLLVAQRFAQPDVPNMDINKDGNINSSDLLLVAQNFGPGDCDLP